MLNERIARLLVALEDLRADLLGLSDDIWLEIDHNDTDELKRGCEFKAQYNELESPEFSPPPVQGLR